MKPTNLDELAETVRSAEEPYKEAKARRKAYYDSISPEREELDQFKREGWKEFFPEWADNSTEGCSVELVKQMADAGFYDKLDRLNAEIAPLLKIGRDLKQIENALKVEYDKALREYDRQIAKTKKAEEKARNSAQWKLVF